MVAGVAEESVASMLVSVADVGMAPMAATSVGLPETCVVV
tara:strand:+ start:1245 stop:1364 length:120 start_codon:yes stop_codon:yes gene_type:complete